MSRRKNEVKLSTELTPKQRAFVDILVANWGSISKADACLQAGYTTKDPNRKPFEIASRLTNPEINPHICRYLEKRLSQELNKYEKDKLKSFKVFERLRNKAEEKNQFVPPPPPPPPLRAPPARSPSRTTRWSRAAAELALLPPTWPPPLSVF